MALAVQEQVCISCVSCVNSRSDWRVTRVRVRNSGEHGGVSCKRKENENNSEKIRALPPYISTPRGRAESVCVAGATHFGKSQNYYGTKNYNIKAREPDLTSLPDTSTSFLYARSSCGAGGASAPRARAHTPRTFEVCEAVAGRTDYTVCEKIET